MLDFETVIRPYKEGKSVLLSDESSSRDVYDLLNGYVLKIPRNERGEMECRNENYIYHHAPEEIKKHLCPIVLSNKIQDNFVVMKKIHSFDFSHFEIVFAALKEKKKVIDFLIGNYGLYKIDLDYPFNWGKDENGRLLILDFGFTKPSSFLKKMLTNKRTESNLLVNLKGKHKTYEG